jgi:hypothetical protein
VIPVHVPAVIPGAVRHRRNEQSLETARDLEASPRPGHVNENIVHNVLGRVDIPEQHHRQLEQIVLMPLVDPLERLGAAVLESSDQVPFFQHSVFPGEISFPTQYTRAYRFRMRGVHIFVPASAKERPGSAARPEVGSR